MKPAEQFVYFLLGVEASRRESFRDVPSPEVWGVLVHYARQIAGPEWRLPYEEKIPEPSTKAPTVRPLGSFFNDAATVVGDTSRTQAFPGEDLDAPAGREML